MLKKATYVLAGMALAWATAAFSVDKADDGLAAIKEAFPGLSEDAIHPTPVDGWYEIMIGPQIAYVSSDARFLLRGDLIEVATEVNYTENRRNAARLDVLDQVTDGDAIVFKPQNVKHSMTVFTDIDCGYCRKLHSEIADLEALGVEVTYLFFPRAGPGSPSWTKAESVWCADDRNAAITDAKAGKPVPPKSCGDKAIAEQYQLGRMVGLRGTPAIVTASGELISGYLPAQSLVQRLAQSEQNAKVASAK